ncbi:MAG: hypothetical protein AABZ14_07635 [Candidatus Margulisiibacteriota bacterium]
MLKLFSKMKQYKDIKYAQKRINFSYKYIKGKGVEVGALHLPLWVKPETEVQG